MLALLTWNCILALGALVTIPNGHRASRDCAFRGELLANSPPLSFILLVCPLPVHPSYCLLFPIHPHHSCV